MKMTVNTSTQEFVRNNCFTEPTSFILNEKEVSYQAASDYISEISLNTIKQWHFTNKEARIESHLSK